MLLVVSIVTVVAAGDGWVDYGVEYEAKDLGGLELGEGALGSLELGDCPASDEQDTVAGAG